MGIADHQIILYYRVIALILVNIVPSWDIEGRELAYYIAINICFSYLIFCGALALQNLNIYMKAAIISISDIIFALVQYQMISFLHGTFRKHILQLNQYCCKFVSFFRLKSLKPESDKLQLTFRPGMTSFSTQRQMEMTS